MRFLTALAVLLVVGTALPAAAQSGYTQTQQYPQSSPQYGQSAQQYGQDQRSGGDSDRDRRRGRRTIEITSAFYGVENRACEATRQVARSCNGQSSCTVRASNRLCGDPVPNVIKVLTVTYNCRGRPRSVTRWEGSQVGIRCE
jgi:hypothetical protein